MENELIELSNDFKNRMKDKNILIRKLKKIILISYGLIVVSDEQQDISLIPTLRDILSQSLEEHFGVESDESDDDE
tara:strand:- start:544 stop:771 length:228 start_codon:yes stop_codon:yes gene_type:complete